MIKINKDKGLVETLVKKDTTAHEFIRFCEYIEEEKSISRHLNILMKAAEGFQNVDTSHLKSIADALKKLIDKYDKINIAFTVSHQRELELSLLFKDLIKTDYYRFKVFTTTKDATRWLRRTDNREHNHAKRYAV